MKKFSKNRIKVKQILINEEIINIKAIWLETTKKSPNGDYDLLHKIRLLEQQDKELTNIRNEIDRYNSMI